MKIPQSTQKGPKRGCSRPLLIVKVGHAHRVEETDLNRDSLKRSLGKIHVMSTGRREHALSDTTECSRAPVAITWTSPGDRRRGGEPIL
jgi:hypothetical protein